MRSGTIALAALTLAQAAFGFKSLSKVQQNLAYQITSTWENENYNRSSQSWVLAFDYCENIHDGQGITIGFTGFTTSGGDALLMIQRYNKINPHNAFAKTDGLVDCLKKVKDSSSTDCFACDDGACHSSTLCNAAKTAYKKDKSNYIRAQSREDGRDNWGDSQALAQKYNVLLPLAQAFLYDSCVNHACDYPDNDVENLIIKPALSSGNKVGGSKSSQQSFFKSMLDTRKKYMCNSKGCDCCSDSTWRIPGWNWLAEQGYWNLPNPMSIKTVQDGSDAKEYKMKCDPTQVPGCDGAAPGTSTDTSTNTSTDTNTETSTDTDTDTSTRTSTDTSTDSTSTSDSTPTPTSSGGGQKCDGSNDGAITCLDSGNSPKYQTCSNGQPIVQSCSSGLVCKINGNNILCDFP